MTIDLIHSTSSSRLFNATCGLRAPTGGAMRARRDSSRLARHSDPASLGYQREPIAAGSEFHTAAHTGTSQFIGAHT